MKAVPAPLRRRLRDETRPAHDRVDAAFDRFDLTDAHALGGFLEAHHEALSALPLDPAPLGLPGVTLLPLLRADLAALGLGAPVGEPVALASEAERLGAYYVVAGSRMGAQVLSARWREASCPRALSAGRYLSDRTMIRGWKALGAALPAVPVAEHDAVIAGALAAFGRFEAAGRGQAARGLAGAA